MQNNPVNYVDPDGRARYRVGGQNSNWGQSNINAYVNFLRNQIRQIDPTFNYNTARGPNNPFNRSDVQYLQNVLNNAQNAGFCGPGVARRNQRNKPPAPLIEAGGLPHTIIEIPGPLGQYTTHFGNGTFKQYRGSGRPHGNIPRPNIKENSINRRPDGRGFIGKPIVRPPNPNEIPRGG